MREISMPDFWAWCKYFELTENWEAKAKATKGAVMCAMRGRVKRA